MAVSISVDYGGDGGGGDAASTTCSGSELQSGGEGGGGGHWGRCLGVPQGQQVLTHCH